MRDETGSPICSGRIFATPPGLRGRAESGQIMVSLLLMLSIFLLAMVGFAVDLTNLWFHRQAAQTAADSACQAAAMDMLMVAVGTPMPNMGFTPGTPGDCTSGTGTICFYANANGYNGAGFSAASASNSVNWTFPEFCSQRHHSSSSLTAYPFLKVVVSENVKTHFLYTIHGTSYQQVAASCTCGLTRTVPQAAPMLVLNPTISEALYLTGGSHTVVVGGPNSSIQVNSSANGAPNGNSSSNAVYCDGGSGYPVDTSTAGPKGTGGCLSIHGGPGAPINIAGANCILNDGVNGVAAGKLWKVRWRHSLAGVVPASVKLVAPVARPAYSGAPRGRPPKAGADGCPDPRTVAGTPTRHSTT